MYHRPIVVVSGPEDLDPVRLYANYTLCHGDAHVWNLLYPRDCAAASGIRLID